MTRLLVLAIDVGSSSIRASLYDQGGRLVPGTETRIERTFTTAPDGASEMDARRAFSDLVTVVDKCLERSTAVNAEITHVAIATFWHSLLGLDAHGKPTTPVLGWADTRAGKYTGELRKRFEERTVHSRVGARFHSSFWPAKLLMLRREQPKVWSQTSRWLSLSDYLMLRLTGKLSTSMSMASGICLFDLRECTWDRELLRYLKIRRDQLPVVDDGALPLAAKYARRWPRLANAAWHAPIADGVANSIGSGCVTRDKAALMLGTSGAMRVIYEGKPPRRIPPGIWCYRIDKKRVILGGALSDGGNLIQWLTTNLVLPPDWQILIARRNSNTTPTLLPFFSGERSTGYDEDARGAILGLNVTNDSIDIVRAAMTAVAGRFAEILKQLESIHPVDEIVVSGGALREFPVWNKILGQVLDRRLTISRVPEATSRGAVLHCLGLAADESSTG